MTHDGCYLAVCTLKFGEEAFSHLDSIIEALQRDNEILESTHGNLYTETRRSDGTIDIDKLVTFVKRVPIETLRYFVEEDKTLVDGHTWGECLVSQLRHQALSNVHPYYQAVYIREGGSLGSSQMEIGPLDQEANWVWSVRLSPYGVIGRKAFQVLVDRIAKWNKVKKVAGYTLFGVRNSDSSPAGYYEFHVEGKRKVSELVAGMTLADRKEALRILVPATEALGSQPLTVSGAQGEK